MLGNLLNSPSQNKLFSSFSNVDTHFPMCSTEQLRHLLWITKPAATYLAHWWTVSLLFHPIICPDASTLSPHTDLLSICSSNTAMTHPAFWECRTKITLAGSSALISTLDPDLEESNNSPRSEASCAAVAPWERPGWVWYGPAVVGSLQIDRTSPLWKEKLGFPMDFAITVQTEITFDGHFWKRCAFLPQLSMNPVCHTWLLPMTKLPF